jgi:hypothetical protein
MVFTPGEMVKELRELQPLKAYMPIVVNPAGRVRELRELQF